MIAQIFYPQTSASGSGVHLDALSRSLSTDGSVLVGWEIKMVGELSKY
jgi:hypothetical protein